MTDKSVEPRSNGSLRERAFVLTVMTFVLLTPPVLLIFDSPVTILGIPLLHVYSFFVWLIAIVIGGLLAGRMQERGQPAGVSQLPGDEGS